MISGIDRSLEQPIKFSQSTRPRSGLNPITEPTGQILGEYAIAI